MAMDLDMDSAMVGVSLTDQPVLHYVVSIQNCVTSATDKIHIQTLLNNAHSFQQYFITKIQQHIIQILSCPLFMKTNQKHPFYWSIGASK